MTVDAHPSIRVGTYPVLSQLKSSMQEREEGSMPWSTPDSFTLNAVNDGELDRG